VFVSLENRRLRSTPSAASQSWLEPGFDSITKVGIASARSSAELFQLKRQPFVGRNV
jgi:hypothetical protein